MIFVGVVTMKLTVVYEWDNNNIVDENNNKAGESRTGKRKLTSVAKYMFIGM